MNIKYAKSPPDPAQQKIRDSKKIVNKEISAFIDNLIHFKQMMNGKPSKFFQEKSSIKEPIPADPVTIIGSLAGDFQDINQKISNIVRQQLDYSKTRRQKQPKLKILPSATTVQPQNDLSKQLEAFQKYELIAEGSNSISRFFTRLLTPTFGVSEEARIRKYRITLLDNCVKIYKNMGKLQVEIVKSSPESITNSYKLLHEIWNEWILVYRGLSAYKLNMPKSTDKKTVEDKLPDTKNKPPVVDVEDKSIVDIDPFNQIETNIEAENDNQLEAVAQNFIKKWIGKTKHKLSLFDQTSIYRLDIFKMADNIRRLLDQIMNSLEKGMNVTELDILSNEVNKSLTTIIKFTRALKSNNILPPVAK